MSFKEKLVEGKYLYFKDNNQYSEETFLVSTEEKTMVISHSLLSYCPELKQVSF